jgi:protein tyrosine phosphatase (PTP) superfamily phosphohydrolase (DUF442 family)
VTVFSHGPVARLHQEATRALLSLGAVLLASVSLAETPLTPESIKGPVVWGATPNVTHYGNLWFSGQPDQAGLEAARRAGVSVVVNLRHPSEFDWNERSAAESLGFSYHNLPVVGTAPLSHETFAAIDALIEEHQGEQVLVHCASSNRVGAWFTVHLVSHRGMSLENALPVGRKAGLTKKPLVEKVRAYLETGGEEQRSQ